MISLRLSAALGVVLFCLALAAPAAAQDGVQHLEFSFGPVKIAPGQNTIELERNDQRPAVDGYIVGFRPNLVFADGSVPRVDVIHLHHGVWLSNLSPLFAAGEEKTANIAPPGYGWRYKTSDRWDMNHMIHNLTPTPRDGLHHLRDRLHPGQRARGPGDPDDRDGLAGHGRRIYPVFDAKRGQGGRDRRFTYPDEAAGRPRPSWTVPDDRRPGRDRRAPAPGRALDRPDADARRPSTRLFRSRRSITSRPARCRGTSR